MKAGIKVVLRMRASNDSEWDEMGTFYVEDWYAEVTGLLANITCYDVMRSVLNAPAPAIPVMKNTTYIDAFNSLLGKSGVPFNVDNDIQGKLSWWYCLATIGATLKELSKACFVASFCGRDGSVKVHSTYNQKPVVHTLTDGNQIISAAVTQDINRDNDGLSIVLNKAQISDRITLLDVKEYNVPPGVNSSGALSFSDAPMAFVEIVRVSSNSQSIDLRSFKCTPSTIDVTLRNADLSAAEASLAIYGRVIETVKSEYTKDGLDPFIFDNVYVQTEDAAKLAYTILTKFISNRLPTLQLSIRGNPKIKLGDKVAVESTKYNLSFVGVLKRAKYIYDGSLRCDIELINSNMLEVL